jgi:hypothetical protein
MHPTIASLYFIGLLQPIGCIWRLADYQDRIAALHLSGRLRRPYDLEAASTVKPPDGALQRPGTGSRSTIGVSSADSDAS